jgi:hypothetical protein
MAKGEGVKRWTRVDGVDLVDGLDGVDGVDGVTVREPRCKTCTWWRPRRFNLCAFAALREILCLGFRAREAVGAPGLGSDAVVYEEKAGGIVFFFDGF